MKTDLDLPERTSKPRLTGRTMVIDTGLPTAYFEDGISSYGEYVDIVKFGWNTAVVTKDIDRKTAVLRDNNVKYCFGGTMFEKFLSQNRVDSFLELVRQYKMSTIEVSNGTISITNTEKCEWITKLSGEFEIVSEVGSKDQSVAADATGDEWVTEIQEDFAAGSTMVITEARESGKSGIADADGNLRSDIIDEIFASDINIDKVLFEAPNKQLQTYFIKRVGTNVSLGNIALDDIIGLETLRLGLRSDTLLDWDK